MNVYVLDYLDYDNRGGQAEAFATLEEAWASVDPPVVEWVERTDTKGRREWYEQVHGNPHVRQVVVKEQVIGG